MRLYPLLIGLGSLALAAVEARAQTDWVGVGIDGNWSDPLDWQYGVPPTTGQDVLFQNMGLWSTVNLDENAEVGHLYLENTTGISLGSAGNYTLTVDDGIYYLSSYNVNLGLPIVGAGVLWLDGGTGTVTLTANSPGQNTYSGSTEVYAGATLTDGAPDSFSANSTLFIGGASPGTVNVNYNEVIGGLGDVAGGPGVLHIASTAILTIQGAYTNSYSGAITGSGSLLYAAAGPLELTGTSPFTGTLTIANGSTVQIGSGATGSIAAGTVTGYGSLAFGLTTPYTFAGNIGSGVQVVQAGTGAITLSGANTYSGGTVVSAGSLLAGADNAFGSGALLVNGGTLNLNGHNVTVDSLAGAASGTVQIGTATLTLQNNQANTTFAGSLLGSGTLVVDNYVLELTGTGSTFSGTTIINGTVLADNATGYALGVGSGIYISTGGTLQLGDLDTRGFIDSSDTVLNYGTLTFAYGSGAYTFNKLVVGTGQLLKYGASTVALGNASYSGPTTINAGTLTDAQANGLSPNSDITIEGAGTLAVAYNEVVGSLQDTIGSGGVTLAGGATLSSNGNNYSTDFSGPISGAGALAIVAGVQGLSGNNTYSGGTTISGTGELFVGSNTALGTGTLTFTGPGPELSPDANVTLANNIVLDATFDNDDGGNNSLTLTGQISGSAEIEWCAPGTLTLANGGNTFTGGVDMREGNLILAATNAAGVGGPITLNNGTSLVVQNGVSVSNPINVTANSTAATLAGSGTIASAVTAGAYTNLAASAAPGGGPGTLTFSNGLTLANGGTLTLSVYDATGSAGTGYSLVSATGGLNISASAGGFAINVVSINSTGGPAAALDFNPGSSYAWKFATSSSAIAGFSASAFTVSNGLLNATNGGSFSVSECGNSLVVDFTPVPEPGTWALIGAGSLGLLAYSRHRLRRPLRAARR